MQYQNQNRCGLGMVTQVTLRSLPSVCMYMHLHSRHGETALSPLCACTCISTHVMERLLSPLVCMYMPLNITSTRVMERLLSPLACMYMPLNITSTRVMERLLSPLVCMYMHLNMTSLASWRDYSLPSCACTCI